MKTEDCRISTWNSFVSCTLPCYIQQILGTSSSIMLGSATQLLLGQAVLPYTFTTAELEALKTKLMTAEQTINTTGKGQHTVLQISLSEIKTLLRMIDMTYLQGLRYVKFILRGTNIACSTVLFSFFFSFFFFLTVLRFCVLIIFFSFCFFWFFFFVLYFTFWFLG